MPRKLNTEVSNDTDNSYNVDSSNHAVPNRSDLSENSSALRPPRKSSAEITSVAQDRAITLASDSWNLNPSKASSTEIVRWSTSVHTLLDQPPSVLPQRIILGGTVFFFAFVAWAWFGQIEQIGKAYGKLIPEGETYKIQPVELGKVIEVTVEEGQEVKAGQVLVELDTELANKEVERIEQMLHAYRMELSQKQDLLAKATLESQTNATIAAAASSAHRSAIALEREKAQTIRRLLAQQDIEGEAYRQRQTRLSPTSQIAQERLNQLQAQIGYYQERVERIKPLVEQGAISQEFLFQAEQELRQTQQQIPQSQLQDVNNVSEQIFQADQALRDIEARITQQQGELASTVQEIGRLQIELAQKQAEEQRVKLEAQQRIKQFELEIAELKGKIAETQTLLASAQTKVNQKYFKAPVNGIVSSLEIKQPGRVVQAGETVAEIAPQESSLILSAMLPNEKAGLVKEGMPVQVKLDAYPFQDYGIIPGKVTFISADSKSDQQLGEVYQVEIMLEKDHVIDNQQPIKFKAGQTATADIIIRRRRILDVVLDPIRQLKDDGINM
ncbi:HlyD family efflux transporter periplasmic adaptor subunit [Pleurocapsa sp. PCC 7319]|uniref:HlyD family efflux transporter periplasmic adaptor subunit n=1 Tax=Pleurocapsa sp. PCC 7319 TaxID=118161 RepID=UPI00036A717E|nr:HlyD family efflux transporter periplasmic adaptor subunit [Pleurocapsa sp. PCC 7319]